MISAFSIVRAVRDLLFFFLFMHTFTPRLVHRWSERAAGGVLLFACLTAALVGAVSLFGRGGPFALSVIAEGPADALAFCAALAGRLYLVALATVMGLAYYGLPPRVALLEGLTFTLAVRVGQMIYSDVVVSLVDLAAPGQALTDGAAFETVMVSAIYALTLLLLAPTPESADAEAVGFEHIMLMGFTLVVFLFMRTTPFDAGDPGAVALRALQCFTLFMMGFLVKRAVGAAHAALASGRQSAMLRAEYDRLMARVERDERDRELRHDLRHAIELLKLDAKTCAYAERLEGDLATETARVYSPNPILNALLNETHAACDARGIAFDIRCNAGPCTFIGGFDLCTVLGNAFDNAIEATSRMPERQRRISFEVVEKAPFVVFRIENTYSCKVAYRRGRIASTKQDGEHHGLGLSSIEHTAETYGATVIVEPGDGVFKLVVSFPLPRT